MKKIILLIAIITFAGVHAQKVSPYYPKVNISESPSQFRSQFTYFDSNFITNRISELMELKYMMTQEKYEDKNFDFEKGGLIDITYVDKFSTSGNKTLKFSYNTFVGIDDFIVKSVKITGSPERVLKFYTTYWNTTLNIKEYGKNAIVENNYGQDNINLHLNNGKPYITIKNSTFKTDEAFISYFKELVNKDSKASL